MTARGWACAAPLAVVLAGPAVATAAPGRLVFEGGTPRPRAVRLTPDAIGGGWSGLATVVVRSDARVKGHLRLRYFPVRGEPVRIVGRPRDSSPLVAAERPRRGVVRMLPHQLLAVDLRFKVPSTQPLSAIDGTLVATLYDTPRRSTPFPAELQIRAGVPPARFAPAAVRLRVIRACWLILGTCHSEAQVTIRGDGVGRLQRPEFNDDLGSALLRNGDGTAARLSLVENGVIGEGDDAIVATVAATDFEGVGEMSGSLPLEPASPGGPALAVEVTVGDSLALAVLVVFLGAALGGWLVQRAGVRRKRRLLELEVRSALSRYDHELGSSGGRAASYELKGLLEPRPGPGVTIGPYPGKHGSAALIWHIRTAQDELDFDDAIARTGELVAQIDRWIGVESVARATGRLLASEPPMRGNVPFTTCLAYREADELLARAQLRAPGDEAEAEQLRGDLAAAGELLGRWKVLWELRRALEGAAAADERVAGALRRKDIKQRLRAANEQTIERRLPPRAQRTTEDVLRLQVDLKTAIKALGDVMTQLEVELPNTIDQRVDSARQLTEELLDVAQHPAIPSPARPPDTVLTRLYLLQVLRDLFWTLLRAAVAATAYALVIYDDTWGSVLDFATAFTTGFANETIVNWAILPALQSYRVRRTGEAGSSEAVLAQLQRALAEDPVRSGNGAQLTPDPGAPTAPH